MGRRLGQLVVAVGTATLLLATSFASAAHAASTFFDARMPRCGRKKHKAPTPASTVSTRIASGSASAAHASFTFRTPNRAKISPSRSSQHAPAAPNEAAAHVSMRTPVRRGRSSAWCAR